MKPYYIIYQVTNSINDKIYIGCHKTEKIDDDYMGSGKYLNNAKNKHGIENFNKEILHVFDNSDEMFKMESELVNEEFIARTDTYNLRLGGFGGWEYINNNRAHQEYIDLARAGGLAKATARLLNPDRFKESDRKSSIRMKNYHASGVHKYDNFKGKKHKQETKEKIGNANSLHQSGTGNSQYGTCWIYNIDLKNSKKIKKEDIQQWLDEGWLSGRKMKF